MAEAGTCSAVRTGIGAQQCIKGNPLKMFRKFFLGVPGFTFDTFADYQDQDVWNAAIAAGNIFPLENIEAVEDSSTEESVVDTDAGSKKKTRDGRYGFIIDMDMTLAQNKVFQSYGTLNWTLFIVDDDDNLIAQTPDGTVVGGMTISYFNPMPMKPTLGSDDYSKTRLEIQLEYKREFNEDICVALGSELDWSAIELQPVTTVTISNVSIAAFVITASFNIVDTTIASLPTVPIRTLTPEDLIVIDEGGLVVTLTQPDIVETSTPGTWEITTSAMVSGTIQQVATATSFYESAQTAVTP
jgi:hypothetical protein